MMLVTMALQKLSSFRKDQLRMMNKEVCGYLFHLNPGKDSSPFQLLSRGLSEMCCQVAECSAGGECLLRINNIIAAPGDEDKYLVRK